VIRSASVFGRTSTLFGLATALVLACTVEDKGDYTFTDASGTGGAAGRGGNAGKGGSAGKGSGGKAGSAGMAQGGQGGDGEGGDGQGGEGGDLGQGGMGGDTGEEACESDPCVNGTCVPNGSSYTCDCLDGFTGSRCETNVDDCAVEPCLNSGVCEDRVAGFECDCSGTGYAGDTCDVLIQNCAESPCENGGICTDVGSSRTCDCTGTGATGDSCEVDIDECVARPCVHGVCTNGRNTYTCDCDGTGYRGTDCDEDINECASGNGGCDALTACTNTDGGRTCSACPMGYSGTGATGCADINECSSNNGGCDPLTTCTNTAGSRTCGACPMGYSGTGATGCTDINECAMNNGGCDSLTTCTNTIGGRTCGACPAGYSGNGQTGCVNINECSPNPCRNGGTCTDGINAFTCTCASPWTGSVCGNATLTIPHSDRGWWTDVLQGTDPNQYRHDSNNKNTLVGNCCSNISRAYFVFPIPNFVGTVSNVVFRVEHENFTSPQASETIEFWSYEGSVATLMATGTSLAVYNDLGAGSLFATRAFTAATIGINAVTLSAAARTAVGAARAGNMAIGAHLSTLTTGATNEYVRFSSSSEARTHELVVTVVP
jgi:hypothetical protein